MTAYWKSLGSLPAEAWISVGLLLTAGIIGLRHASRGWGLPLATLIGTISIWYVGDAIYNRYETNHVSNFHPQILSRAWYQLSLFVLALIIFAPLVSGQINRSMRKNGSLIMEAVRRRERSPAFQSIEKQIPGFQRVIIAIFLVLAFLAILRLGERSTGYFFPWISGSANPWARGRVSLGPMDAVWALLMYLQQLIAAGFGLIAVFAQSRRSQFIGLAGMFLTWPFYLLDRTRNLMIAVVLPALLSWLFLKHRGSTPAKIAILAVAFVFASTWFGFVLSARDEMSVSEAFLEGGISEVRKRADESRHLGMNMLEELCWINTFLENGRLSPNHGKRYFAELVNPIPRAIWPGKPTIGLDYAFARGMAWEHAATSDGGLAATISTGMIGQGVNNFGTVFGPIAAAFLASCWIAFLAHLDLTANRVGRLPLYAIGLVATFNLGRDITLLTLYPFLFGYAAIWAFEKFLMKPETQQ